MPKGCVSMWHVPLLLLGAVALRGPATVFVAGECFGDGGYMCPALDPVEGKGAAYDPASVDWDAVVADIMKIGALEPRFCNMAIRAWFHDVTAFGNQAPVGDGVSDEKPFETVSDGSIFINEDEAALPHSSHHGLGRIIRHIVVQLAAAHGASHVDVVTVAAAKCTNGVLAGNVDIADHCDAQGVPLYVGKQDLSATSTEEVEQNSMNSHTFMPEYMRFFLKDVNPHLQSQGEQWVITESEAMSLMGGHTLNMPMGCMTNGQQPDPVPALDDRTAGGTGGRQRIFTWDNGFFQDVTSGDCSRSNDEENGRPLTAAEWEAMTSCSYNSMEGFALGEQMECESMKSDAEWVGGSETRQWQLDNRVHDEGWYHGRWTPGVGDNSPAPCAGFLCQTCEGDNDDSKFWCGGSMKDGMRFWPYTYMDCHINSVVREGTEWCLGSGDNEPVIDGVRRNGKCDHGWYRFNHGTGELDEILGRASTNMAGFAANSVQWQQEFATAFCKLSHFGASYSAQRKFTDVFTGGSSGGCLSAVDVISPKQCKACTLDKYQNTGSISGSPLNLTPAPDAVTPSPALTTSTAVTPSPSEVMTEAVPEDMSGTAEATTVADTTAGDVPQSSLRAWLAANF